MIHVEGLSKCYHDLLAVDSISFDIHKGEILGLLGPNGAGKTTFMRMLTGYLKPTSGTITVGNYSIESDPLSIKALMGYLPESAPLYADMLVYDYLLYVAGIRRLKPEKKKHRIQHLVDLCGLNDVMHKPVGALSKGYKQRVGLAHAMMVDPQILVLDEPTSGLDPNQIVEIRDIIRRIGKEKTVILSTHILSEAEAVCDRVVIIHKGRVVADAPTEKLKATTSRESRIVISLRNADDGAVHQLFEDVPNVLNVEVMGNGSGNLEVKITCSGEMDAQEAIYLAVKKTDWILTELYEEQQTLETIFRQITREH